MVDCSGVSELCAVVSSLRIGGVCRGRVVGGVNGVCGGGVRDRSSSEVGVGVGVVGVVGSGCVCVLGV